MMKEFLIYTGGVLTAAIGLGHCFFYSGFGWEEEFNNVSQFASKVLYTIHIFQIPFLFLIAYLSFFHAGELAGKTPMGITITAFCSVFWLFRWLWQVLYFNPFKLKGSSKLHVLNYILINNPMNKLFQWGTDFK